MSTTVPRQKQSTSSQPTIRQSIQREHSFEEMRVEGRIPEDLNGTLYRNGPGLYELFGKPYAHMFECDGAVSAVRLEGGKARGALRVVESNGLKEERRQGKPLYGFNAPWWRRFWHMKQDGLKNTANTNVVVWQDRLFALMEASMPTELSMEDLSTIGETDLGVIPQSFSAHPHDVPGRKSMYNFGMRYGKDSMIDLFALPYQGKARHIGSIPLKFPVMLHDFMVTESHFVFFVSPVKISVLRALLALGPFEKMFQWAPQEGVEVIIAPIEQPDQAVRFHTDSFYQWHFGNGYEQSDEIIVDFVRYPGLESLGALQAEDQSKGAGRESNSVYARAILDPKARSIRQEVLWQKGCEFPRVHPQLQGRKYRYVWLSSLSEDLGVTGNGANEISCLDTETGQAETFTLPPGMVASEPVFVPAKDSTTGQQGYALSYIYDEATHSSYMGIFEGGKVADGPVAKVWFDQHIPTTFHGNWVPA